MFFRKIKKNYKKIFLGVITILLTIIISNNFKAANAAPNIDIINGNFVITIETKAASNYIKYRTIGYTITTKPAPETAYAKGRTGPAAPPTPNVEKYFDEFEKEELYRDDKIVKTRYTLSQDKVKALMKKIIDLDKISETTILYFNAIFQTYQVVDGKEVILNPKITTWKEIVNDQSWDNIDVFKDYFNVPLTYNPGSQPNNLYYDVDGTIIDQGALDSLKIGEYVTWKNRVKETITLEGITYSLKGFYAKAKLDQNNEITRKIVGKNVTAADIINSSVKVLYGGMNIYMIYEPVNVNITIDARDIETKEDIKKGLYNGTKKPGEKFSESIDKIIGANGISYEKTKYFEYFYIESNENLTKINCESNNDDDPIEFKIPDNVKPGSTITVKAYYKKLVDGTIPITVNAINKSTGALIETLITSTAKAGDEFKYAIKDPLTSGNKTYNFTGEWKWQYKKNTSSAPTITNTGSGTKISFKVPSADEISGGITVNLYYKQGKDVTDGEIKLRVIMVSKTGALIEEISTETVKQGQAINKSIESSRNVGGITYYYQDKWDYTYSTSSGDTTKTGSGNTASFTIPSNTKLGTVVILRLYYNAKQDVDVPDAEAPIELPLDTPVPYAVIDGDKYGAQYFISKQGISTTESQHVYVKTKDYLLGYRLINKTGTVTFTVPVTMTYTIKYFTATPEEFGGPQEITDTVSDTQYISVERAYSYWEIDSFEYYIPSSANVYNYSLPNEQVHLSTNHAYLDVPSLITSHSSSRDSHVFLPKEAKEGIQLTYDTEIFSDSSTRPDVPFVDLTPYALEMTGEVSVRNDYIEFDGITVMSDSVTEKIAPTPNAGVMVHSNNITHDKVLYTEGQIIDAKKRNGVYPSNGNVTYERHYMSVYASPSKTYNMSVNDVTIHTPVICDPVINADNDKWVQLIDPTPEAYHMVLDPDSSLNDFTVRISNKLPHSDRLGYYERDFSRSFIDPENVSYIAKKDGVVRNEMKLPFDVYKDVNNDNNPENDVFIKAGTWIILGRDTHRFYVPIWVQEGVYTAQFRTIAVNGEDRLDNTETTRNANINNYVATATRTFQISGRIYGFTLYDISDEGRWKDVFRKKNTMMIKYFEGAEDGTKRTNYHDDYAYYYTVGTKNQYGHETGRYNKFTLPLINGSHPKYDNIGAIKTGYAFRFMLDTTGEMYGSGCKIRIIPTFYYIDKNGKNRQPVDIYYDEEINGKEYRLVKVGAGIDLINMKQGLVGNPYSRIPEAELKHTAKVLDTTYSKLINQYGAMYTYSEIRISNLFRTFIGLDYAKNISKLNSFSDAKKETGESELSLSKYMQRWYGTYKLPTNIHVAPAGYDVNGYLIKHGIDYTEDFWLKDGYIIINFNIETCDKNGKRHLSYINGENYLNKGHCSMWVTEGAVVQKKDNNGITFSFKGGDVILYYTDKNYKDDFKGYIY